MKATELRNIMEAHWNKLRKFIDEDWNDIVNKGKVEIKKEFLDPTVQAIKQDKDKLEA